GLRSSPDANVGCSCVLSGIIKSRIACCDPHPTRTSGAAARRARRWLGCAGRCDPHPTRTSGAARADHDGWAEAMLLRSSPDANVLCSSPTCKQSDTPKIDVAILTRRERLVQPPERP